jgi:hypothetical protein
MKMNLLLALLKSLLPNLVGIKSFDINSILEQKITDAPILDDISELKKRIRSLQIS